MTRISAAAAAALFLTTTALSAGGLDRSGQPISALFETGSYAELGFGLVQPSVSGTFTHPLAGELASGSVANDYSQLTFALKMDLNEQLSLALILDQPYGAAVEYSQAGYPLNGTFADLRSQALTALLRYKINDRFSVHGGVRSVGMEADLQVSSPAGTYAAEFDNDRAIGYIVGAAYEIPDIALRVALTYSSETEFSNPTSVMGATGAWAPVANTEFVMPQQIALDFQTGIAANTLLMGQIRWVEWTATEISPQGYPGNPLVSYSDDRITYTVGIGRKFSDSFSGAISVSYEEDQGNLVSNLSPTDGSLSIQIGGSYTMNNVELSGGIRYIMVGDATTETIGAEFADNSGLAIGMSVGYHF